MKDFAIAAVAFFGLASLAMAQTVFVPNGMGGYQSQMVNPRTGTFDTLNPNGMGGLQSPMVNPQTGTFDTYNPNGMGGYQSPMVNPRTGTFNTLTPR
jgi:hypothetical protein